MLSRSFILLLVTVALVGCRPDSADSASTIRVWGHQGQEAENAALRQIAARFNAAHAEEGLRVELTFFPDFQYTEKLAIAAAGGDLPDAFEADGPTVARLVEAGLLAPLDPYFSAEELDDFLPTLLAQGTIDGHLYALGAFESAVVLYYDRALLAQAGVTPPPPQQGWTWEEFLAACRRLRAAGLQPVALHFNESADEWYTYAFAPVIWSGGGALIADDGATVTGVLSSPANVASLQQWQQLFLEGHAATDPVDPDPFGSGAVAMDWTGHWMARSHLEAKGERLGAMVLPRLGREAVAPSGSWCWGMSADAEKPEQVARWLKWVTSTEEGVIPMVRANGAVPGRRSAFAAFPEYSSLPYSLFATQLQTIARARPRTPFYATLTQRFAGALREIARGADVAERLRTAEAEVQAVIARRRPLTAEAPTP